MNIAKSLLGTLGLLFIFVFGTSEVRSAEIYWKGTEGNWETSTNWSPASVPGVGDAAFVNNGGTATITAKCGANLRIGFGNSTTLTSPTGIVEVNADGQTITCAGGGIGRHAGRGTLKLKAGTLTLSANLALGAINADATDVAGQFALNKGEFIQSGGTLKVEGYVFSVVGSSGNAVVGGNGKYTITGGDATFSHLAMCASGAKVAERGSATNPTYSNASFSVEGGTVMATRMTAYEKSNLNISGGSMTVNSPQLTKTNIEVSGGELTLNDLTAAGTLTGVTMKITGGTVNWNYGAELVNTVFQDVKTVLQDGTLNVSNNLKNYNSELVVVDGTLDVGKNAIQAGSSGGGTFTMVGGNSTWNFLRWALGANAAVRNKLNFLATSTGLKTIQSQASGTNYDNWYTTDLYAGISGGMTVLPKNQYTLLKSTNVQTEQISFQETSVWDLQESGTSSNYSVTATLDGTQKKGTIKIDGNGASVELLEGTTLGNTGWLEIQGDGGNVDYSIGLTLLDGGNPFAEDDLLQLSDTLNTDAYGYLESTAEEGILWMKGLNLSGAASTYFAYDFTKYGDITVQGIQVSSSVPEPASWLLLLLLLVGGYRYRRF